MSGVRPRAASPAVKSPPRRSSRATPAGSPAAAAAARASVAADAPTAAPAASRPTRSGRSEKASAGRHWTATQFASAAQVARASASRVTQRSPKRRAMPAPSRQPASTSTSTGAARAPAPRTVVTSKTVVSATDVRARRGARAPAQKARRRPRRRAPIVLSGTICVDPAFSEACLTSSKLRRRSSGAEVVSTRSSDAHKCQLKL